MSTSSAEPGAPRGRDRLRHAPRPLRSRLCGRGDPRAAARLAFDELGLHRIIGRCDARNTASARLMERLGMRREAHLRENEFVKGEWTDELIYAMLAGEWQARASR